MKELKSISMLPALQDCRVLEWVAVDGDQTLRLDYDLNPESVVLDLGAYRGDFASEILSRYGAHLYLFEPVPAFVAHIRKRFEGMNNVTVLPYALGAEEGEVVLSLDADATSGFKSGSVNVAVQVKPICDVLGELGLKRIDLLKINVEGAEYDILKALVENGRVADIQDIQVQFHDFVDDAEEQLRNIRGHLMKTHYVTYAHNYVWENWRRRSGICVEDVLHESIMGSALLRERVIGQHLQIAALSRKMELLGPLLYVFEPLWWLRRLAKRFRRWAYKK